MEIIATVDSLAQAEQLLEAGVDRLYVGQSPFGLRLPRSFSLEEISEMTSMAHQAGKKITVALNGLMHNKEIKQLPPFLEALDEIGVDAFTCGDPGTMLLVEEYAAHIPFIYDAQTFVTSSEQIKFWETHGAVGAVLARELTSGEIADIQSHLTIPVEVLVYGPTCIHHSKRKLVTNYEHIVKIEEDTSLARGLFLREPNDENSQLPIYEDETGTHIFSTEDISLMPFLEELYQNGIKCWKLDGILCETSNFVQIAKLFVEAKAAIEAGSYVATYFENKLAALQKPSRQLAPGFYTKDPNEVK
ncbi:peptidase U32 family protein [Listeria grayi]|uniref:Peptidase, U32 family n=1 Tax=Listeria grayi DSM 20601 TaxID=525367 RepID=D7V0V2_LISGR|nr:peptidase U32 family protein [Listeria grayi]EFI83184.1 peptidase, U32 family [Listeria grayi DSM 20601]